MNIPKYLYHGTSASSAQLAMGSGLLPRSATKRSNWKHSVPSCKDAIYLTDAYPLYFAQCAAEKEQGAVIQIDTSKLDQFWLVPDEDVLEQAGRGRDGVEGDMKRRTKFYRQRLNDYLATDKWLVSLQAMGTCASLKEIPASAISRVAFIDFNEAPTLALTALDASICLANYKFCADKYRNLTGALFGLEQFNPDPFGFTQQNIETLDEASRDGLHALLDYNQKTKDVIDRELRNAVRIVEPARGECIIGRAIHE